MEYSISDDSEQSDFENAKYQFLKERSIDGFPVCRGCLKPIYNKYYLRVNEASWHEECLKCSHCNIILVNEETCFFKKNKIFCKLDYYKYFGIKCAKCSRNIQSSDWVRRAKDNVYHLACFACENCKRQLSTGEEFALQNNKVLCKTHYCESIDGDSSSKEAKNKRVRTTFTEEQLQVLQANFEVDSNPDGQDLERIAQITGLSKRVTQVWFQNSRARQKKYKEKKIDMNSGLEINEASNEDMWTQSDMNISRKRTLNNNYQIVYENQGQIEPKNYIKRNHDPRFKKLTDNTISMSWTSDDSVSDDDGQENSMYDSSLEYSHDLD